MEHKTICLNMIVKNEKETIRRSLASVKNLINYWVIVDTGSDDGTQELIKEIMQGIPGELHERPWVNFAHNRNEALFLSKNKGDYLLFIDADEELVFSENFVMPSLDKDYYVAITYCNETCYSHRILMINHCLQWEWKGVLHEELISPEAKSGAHLENMFNNASCLNSSRSKDPDKHLKEAQILEKALEEDPENLRYLFHLALAYEASNERSLALKIYERRAKAMGGKDLEVFYSLYRIAILQEVLGMPSDLFIKNYKKAHRYRPSRPEPLFSIIRHYLQTQQYSMAYSISKYALSLPFKDDAFFTQIQIYNYGLLYQFAECAYHLGKHDETCAALKELLKAQKLPSDLHMQIKNNLALLQNICT